MEKKDVDKAIEILEACADLFSDIEDGAPDASPTAKQACRLGYEIGQVLPRLKSE